MLNQVTIVGRITEKPTIQKLENGDKITIIKLLVTRTLKNVNGEYDSDIIPCKSSGNLAEYACENLNQGYIVGIKGHIETTENKIEICAEKITYLNNNKEEGEK